MLSYTRRYDHSAIKTLLNLVNSATYDFCLVMAALNTLEQTYPAIAYSIL